MFRFRSLFPLLLLPGLALSATYRVGPYDGHANLQAALDDLPLQPGDTLVVAGNTRYGVGDGLVIRQRGTADAPITIRGERVRDRRPVLVGGNQTVRFEQADHVRLEGFEISGGRKSCVFVYADNVVLRDLDIHHCPEFGVHASDLAGSLTIEYTEIHHIGAAGNDNRHAIYAQTGELDHPGALFRLRFSYVHDGLSGNLVKSRAERTELHYNWIEGAHLQEVEMLSPDPDCQRLDPDCDENPDWSERTAREDGEMVGNVIVHRGSRSSYAVRLGGDGTGEGSAGRYRLINNTFVFERPGTALRLFARLLSVDARRNAFLNRSGGPLQIYRDWEAEWVAGAQIFGQRNLVDPRSQGIPSDWTRTLYGDGSDVEPLHPAGRLMDRVAMRLTRAPALAADDTADSEDRGPPGDDFANPTPYATYLPPHRQPLVPGQERPRCAEGPAGDIGALTHVDIDVPDADPVCAPRDEDGLFRSGFEESD